MAQLIEILPHGNKELFHSVNTVDTDDMKILCARASAIMGDIGLLSMIFGISSRVIKYSWQYKTMYNIIPVVLRFRWINLVYPTKFEIDIT